MLLTNNKIITILIFIFYSHNPDAWELFRSLFLRYKFVTIIIFFIPPFKNKNKIKNICNLYIDIKMWITTSLVCSFMTVCLRRVIRRRRRRRKKEIKIQKKLIYGIESIPRFYNSSITFFLFWVSIKPCPAGDFHEFSTCNDRCRTIPHWVCLLACLQPLIQLISEERQLRRYVNEFKNKLLGQSDLYLIKYKRILNNFAVHTSRYFFNGKINIKTKGIYSIKGELISWLIHFQFLVYRCQSRQFEHTRRCGLVLLLL